MSDVNRADLRDVLVLNYESLIRKLTSRLGSSENAQDALQDAYLRLENSLPSEPIRSPKDYLFRIALNIAIDRRRTEARRLTTSEVNTLLDVADDRPGPGRIVESRSELRALERALEELPPRRRTILLAAVVQKIPRKAIAKHYGVTARTIDNEVRRALEHGHRRLNQISEPRNCDSKCSESSTD